MLPQEVLFTCLFTCIYMYILYISPQRIFALAIILFHRSRSFKLLEGHGSSMAFGSNHPFWYIYRRGNSGKTWWNKAFNWRMEDEGVGGFTIEDSETWENSMSKGNCSAHGFWNHKAYCLCFCKVCSQSQGHIKKDVFSSKQHLVNSKTLFLLRALQSVGRAVVLNHWEAARVPY